MGENPIPAPRRLNRNAAAVAALVGGALLLIVVSLVTTPPKVGDGEARAQALPLDPATQRPDFLERAPVPPPLDADLDARLHDLAAAREEQAARAAYGDPYGGGYYGGDPYAAGYAAPPAPREPSAREQARERALSAGILAGGGAPRYSAVSGDLSSDMPDAPAYAAALPTTGARARSRLLAADVRAPGHGYEVPAGTLLHAVLVSAVNSDAAGDVVAMVTHDVYDRAMRAVLIPRTTRLIGRPAGSAVMGQRRLSLVWDRLVLPDGSTVLLPETPSQDASGAAGLAARVDNHAGGVMRSALLLSMVGAGAQLSQPQQSATFGQAPSVGQTMAGAAGAELAQVSGEMIRRGMDVRPTLSLPQGTAINVLLTGDLALSPYR